MQDIFNGIFKKKIEYAYFEDVQIAMKKKDYLIINTLSNREQDCLIKNTISYEEEESIINELLLPFQKNEKKIIVYGKNCCDESADKKTAQLMSLGFKEVFLYKGGLFEWLLLQDIYGNGEFPTTKKVLDLLKYRCKE
jgi:hypothetical protein